MSKRDLRRRPPQGITGEDSLLEEQAHFNHLPPNVGDDPFYRFVANVIDASRFGKARHDYSDGIAAGSIKITFDEETGALSFDVSWKGAVVDTFSTRDGGGYERATKALTDKMGIKQDAHWRQFGKWPNGEPPDANNNSYLPWLIERFGAGLASIEISGLDPETDGTVITTVSAYTIQHCLLTAADGKTGAGDYQPAFTDGTLLDALKSAYEAIHTKPPADLSPPVLHDIENPDSLDAFSVEWDAVKGAEQYDLAWGLDGKFTKSLKLGTTTHSFNGLADGEWSFRVQAIKGTTASDWSVTKTTTVKEEEAKPPAAPVLKILPALPLKAGVNDFTLSWAAVDTATGYRLESSLDKSIWATVLGVTGRSLGVTDAKVGKVYYRVFAKNDGGDSPASNVLDIEVKEAPPIVPAIPKMGKPSQPAAGELTVALSWGAVKHAAGYTLQERKEGELEWTDVPDVTGTSKTLSVSAFGHYYFRVRADNKDVHSDWSASVPVEFTKKNAGPSASIAGGPSISLQLPESGEISHTFDGSGSSDPDKEKLTYAWSLDGVVQSEKSAKFTHIFKSAKSYTVSLVVSDGKLTSPEASQTVNVEKFVPEKPSPEFKFSPAAPKVGEKVTFTGSFTGGKPDSWEWVLGSEGTDSGQEITHEFLGPGKQSVRLTTKNAGGQDHITHDVAVVAVNSAPTAKIDGDDIGLNLPSTGEVDHTFIGGHSTDPEDKPLTYNWSVLRPDGETEDFPNNGEKLAYSFKKEGSYTISLVVSDGKLTSPRVSVDATIREYVPHAPIPEFTWVPKSPFVGDEVTFTATNTGGDAEKWSWSIGSEQASTDKIFKHKFEEAGTVTIRLVMSNAGGNDHATHDVEVVAVPKKGDGPAIVAEDVIKDVAYGKHIETVTLDASATTDPDGDLKSIKWFGGKDFEIIPDADKAGIATVTVPTDGIAYAFEVVADDVAGNISRKTITVQLTELDNPAGPDGFAEGGKIILKGNGMEMGSFPMAYVADDGPIENKGKHYRFHTDDDAVTPAKDLHRIFRWDPIDYDKLGDDKPESDLEKNWIGREQLPKHWDYTVCMFIPVLFEVEVPKWAGKDATFSWELVYYEQQYDNEKKTHRIVVHDLPLIAEKSGQKEIPSFMLPSGRNGKTLSFATGSDWCHSVSGLTIKCSVISPNNPSSKIEFSINVRRGRYTEEDQPDKDRIPEGDKATLEATQHRGRATFRGHAMPVILYSEPVLGSFDPDVVDPKIVPLRIDYERREKDAEVLIIWSLAMGFREWMHNEGGQVIGFGDTLAFETNKTGQHLISARVIRFDKDGNSLSFELPMQRIVIARYPEYMQLMDDFLAYQICALNTLHFVKGKRTENIIMTAGIEPGDAIPDDLKDVEFGSYAYCLRPQVKFTGDMWSSKSLQKIPPNSSMTMPLGVKTFDKPYLEPDARSMHKTYGASHDDYPFAFGQGNFQYMGYFSNSACMHQSVIGASLWKHRGNDSLSREQSITTPFIVKFALCPEGVRVDEIWDSRFVWKIKGIEDMYPDGVWFLHGKPTPYIYKYGVPIDPKGFMWRQDGVRDPTIQPSYSVNPDSFPDDGSTYPPDESFFPYEKFERVLEGGDASGAGHAAYAFDEWFNSFRWIMSQYFWRVSELPWGDWVIGTIPDPRKKEEDKTDNG